MLLEDLSWPEAEKLLTPDTVVVLRLGAAAKEYVRPKTLSREARYDHCVVGMIRVMLVLYNRA